MRIGWRVKKILEINIWTRIATQFATMTVHLLFSIMLFFLAFVSLSSPGSVAAAVVGAEPAAPPASLFSAIESNPNAHHRRHAQVSTPTVGTIQELRWINANTNERNVVIDGSFIVPMQDDGEFVDYVDGTTLPPNHAELSMEAIIAPNSGPVGSILFTYNGVSYMENNPPFCLCTNKGADVLPCVGLREHGGHVTAQAYSGKSATGVAGPVLSTHVYYLVLEPPGGSFHIYNADTDVQIAQSNGILPYEPLTINVTQTPHIAAVIDAWSGRFRWNVACVKFDYKNGAKIVVESTPPLIFPGNKGKNLLATFAPQPNTPGQPHSLTATLFSKKNMQGQNTTWTLLFNAVA
jgi:hypothetical protein